VPATRMSGAERREKILATSLSLFAKKGFAATKTKDLARAAGVSEAMVFKLFPDKGSLYRALIERKIAEAEAVLPLAALAESQAPPAEFFGGIAEIMLRRVEEDPSFLRLFLFSALEGHPLAAEFDEARAQGLRRAIETYLRRQERAGTVRRIDPEFTSRAFMGLVAWFAQARTVIREPGSRKFPRAKLVRELVDLFLAGLAPR
jgi:AcrR family transcriptional regulator